MVILIFVIYDISVQRRNEKLVASAARSNAIVSSLFPGNIRDKLMSQQGNNEAVESGKKTRSLKSYVTSGGKMEVAEGKPLAGLYLETTVLVRKHHTTSGSDVGIKNSQIF